jgi:hypothetical protein
MKTWTKEEAVYRLPEKCCRYCQYSFMSFYGGCLCQRLVGIEVDLGGVCDLFSVPAKVAAIPPDIPRPIDTATDTEPVRSCNYCGHSFYDKQMKPVCAVDNALIVDGDSTCGAWEEEATNE